MAREEVIGVGVFEGDMSYETMANERESLERGDDTAWSWPVEKEGTHAIRIV